MTYQIEMLNDESIMVVHLHADFSIDHDFVPAVEDTRLILDRLERPIFYILDLTSVQFGVNDVVSGANRGCRGKDPIWHHPNIREFTAVSESQLIQLAANGLNSLPFGNLDARVFEYLDDALSYCRARIRAG